MKVDLKEWGKENFLYIITWISMGIVIFLLLVWELGFDILVLMAPFLPVFVMILYRAKEEII